MEREDNMFTFTEAEIEKIKTGYFEGLSPLKLKIFPPKQKKKYIVLSIIMNEIEDRIFSEKELNEVLKNIYFDFVTIRRALIDFGFMERTKDGKEYWIKK